LARERRRRWILGNPEAHAASQRKYWLANPERRRDFRLRARYGITLAAFAALEKAQGGACAICQKLSGRLAVDHEHDTGAVRGLLCVLCNAGLGHFDDDEARIERALEYLRSRKACALPG
jgi:hypothetical protein